MIIDRKLACGREKSKKTICLFILQPAEFCFQQTAIILNQMRQPHVCKMIAACTERVQLHLDHFSFQSAIVSLLEKYSFADASFIGLLSLSKL